MMMLSDAGYLACARCASTGSIVLIDPVASANGGNQPLSPPKTERCSNCSGAGKVSVSFLFSFIMQLLYGHLQNAKSIATVLSVFQD